MSCYYCRSLFVVVSIICLISLVQSSSINNGGVSIDLIHRDSPLSPSYDPTKTRFERLRSALDRSFARKSSILSTFTSAPITANGGEYLMEYKIGTPPVRQLSVADTGSDLTWIQCKPCTSCYTQDYPLFDPSSTKSYRPLSCQAKQCATSGLNTGCGGAQQCLYEANYGDRSFSHGELAVETLTLGEGGASFPKFVLGCGRENRGTFMKDGSGIFGLGGGAVSFVNQQGSLIKGKFSYCLTFLDSKVASKISFGSSAVVAGPNVVSTPLVSKSPDTYYYLTLKGLSVGTERFDMEESDSSQGNIIIDSGTTLTYVPAEVCKGVESALAKAIKGKRVEDAQGMFNLCYELPNGGGELNQPEITAHFDGGADVVLPKKNTFIEVEEGVVCLSVVPSQSLAIFGNLHQAGYLIGYDLVKKQLSFQQTADCTN